MRMYDWFLHGKTLQLLGKGYVGTLASEVGRRGEEGDSGCKGPEAERRRHIGGWREAIERGRHRNPRALRWRLVSPFSWGLIDMLTSIFFLRGLGATEDFKWE